MSEDLIRREDAIETAYQLRHKPNDAEWAEWLKSFNAIPSADRPQDDGGTLVVSVEDATKVKRVLVEDGKSGDLYYADRPQGEWIDAEIPLESGGSMPIQACNLCKTFYPLAYTGGGHRFCPNCGARMKGADDE